jgi:hypothetical protein
MALRSHVPAFDFGGAPRVNLMPRAAIERRERGVLIRRWGWGLAATLLVVVLVGAGAFFLQMTAQDRLTAENARTNDLIGQIAALQPVREKLTLQSELADFRAQAMGTDLEWAGVLASIEGVLPEGIAFAEFSLTPGGLPQSDDPATEVGLQGTLVLTGAAPADIVELIRSIRSVPAVLDVDGWAQTFADEQYRYDLRIVIDQTVYTGAYAEESDR